MENFTINNIKDFSKYSQALLKIKTNIPDPDNPDDVVERIIPFTFNEAQMKLHLKWEELLHTVGFVRMIILKARREGMSTYVEGRMFHKIHTNPNNNGFIIAHDIDGTNTIFGMSKLFYEALPRKYRPMKRYSSKKELVFENPNESTRFQKPGLRSKIEVFTASKVNAATAGGYSAAHFSEVAKYPNADLLIASTSPTVPDIPGSFIVYESTAFGMGGFFHEEWIRATSKSKRRETNFVPVFFSWLEFKSYQRAFTDGCDEREFAENLDHEEIELQKKFGANLLQLHWRHHKILDLGNDIDLFHQEYPTTQEEAFIASGQCYFNRRKIQKIIDNTTDPIFRGDISGVKIAYNEEGALKVWEAPRQGESYVLGVDIGGGGRDGDPSVIEVIKIPKGQPILEQVAEYRDWCDPVILASKIIALGLYYNEGLVCPEINNHGHTTLNELKQHYWNIYRWQYFDRFGKQITDKLGWETNSGTRPLLCDYTAACVNAELLIIHSSELAKEMMSFIKRSGLGGEADSGCHDDCVMAFMIAVFCLAHSSQTQSLISQLNIVASPIVEEKKAVILKPTMQDVLAFGQESDQREYLSCDNAWLNY